MAPKWPKMIVKWSQNGGKWDLKLHTATPPSAPTELSWVSLSWSWSRSRRLSRLESQPIRPSPSLLRRVEWVLKKRDGFCGFTTKIQAALVLKKGQVEWVLKTGRVGWVFNKRTTWMVSKTRTSWMGSQKIGELNVFSKKGRVDWVLKEWTCWIGSQKRDRLNRFSKKEELDGF